MRRGMLVSLTVVAIVASVVVGGSGCVYAWYWSAGLALCAIAGICLLWRSVVLPLRNVETGYDLLLSQDFNNTLRKVGERHADKVAELFNTMSRQLKLERTRLREQDSFLHQLIESSPLGVAVLDFDSRITLVNPAFVQMTGVSGTCESLAGHTLSELDSELIRVALAVGDGKSETVRLSDTKIYRCSNLSFMEMGFQRHFFLIESLTAEVMKAERQAYEKVVRTLAHEVNNSMGAIVSILETVGDVCGDDDLAEAIAAGRDRCYSLTDFINGYASVIKLPEPKPVPRDLAKETARMLPFLREMLPEGIDLELDGADGDSLVSLDPVMWEQVVINIVKNAGESIAKGHASGLLDDDTVGHGHIVIRILPPSERHGGGVEIADDGPGISEEVAAKLFTPFFSTKSDGRGLGLTLVNEILTRHKCRFSLKTVPGSTTVFTVLFPRDGLGFLA